MNAAIKPRRAFYLLPLVFLVAAGLPSLLLLLEGIDGIRRPLVRMVAPGTADVVFDRQGRWTVFYEHRSTVDGRVFRSPEQVPFLEISVSDPDGNDVPVDSTAASFEYQTLRAAGSAVATFTIVGTGTYEVAIADDSPAPSGEFVVAFGYEKGRAVGRTVFGAVLLGATVLVALIAVGVIFFLRVRDKRKRDVASPPYAMPPPPPGS